MRSSVLRKAREITFHPLVFATFPILSLFAQNMGKGYLREVLLITAGALVLCVLLWLLVNLLIKDSNRSAIIVSAFFLLFLSFGHALSAANAVLERTGLIDSAWFLVRGNAADLFWVALWGVLIVAISLYVARRLRNLRMATDLMNTVALALVAMLVVSLLSAGGLKTYVKAQLDGFAHKVSSIGTAANSGSGTQGEHRVFIPIVRRDPTAETRVPTYGHVWLETSPPEASAPGPPPDIYYIVLDMYARSDVLRDHFHYDNSEFLSFLEGNGFYVAHGSTANYPYTTHSLASSLNFMYLNDVAQQVGQIRGHSLSASMIANSRLSDYLRKQGYATVAFATGYWFTELKNSDVYLEPTQSWWYPTEFQAGLIELTPLSRVTGIRGTKDDVDRERVLYALEHLADATEIGSPTLVFAHINAPHDPFVFGADGRPVASQPGYTHDQFVEAYREQVAFVSTRAQQTIEEILSRSPEPPIIIVQSDHGATYGSYEEHIAERMSILNALYFPDQGYEDLYPTVSPVNTFRIVLNRFFGTDYDLLDDRSYYSSSQSPYTFFDVTDEVTPGH